MRSELQSLYQQGLHEEVIRKAAQLSIHPTGDPHASLIVAASLLHTGQFRKCQSVCAALESVLSGDAQYLTLYGTCLRRVGELQLSEKVFRHGLALYPEHPTLNNNYANLLIENQKYAEALEILERLVSKHPDYADARANLNRIKSIQNKHAEEDSSRASATEHEVAALLEQASADHHQPPPPPQEVTIDPLRLAFSEDEVRQEQEERRRRRLDARLQADQSEGRESWDVFPDLPEIPAAEYHQELARAASDALADKCPEATLILSDILRRAGKAERIEAYATAAEAYIMLKRYSLAEVLYLCCDAEGGLDINQLINLAVLALERNDAPRAQVCLERAATIHPDHPRLTTLKERVEAVASHERRLAFHPYVGYPS